MLKGEVVAKKMAIVSLRLRGADSTETEAETVLDTGFTEHLALSYDLINSLGWPRQEATLIMFGDGNIHRVDVYEGEIWWDDEWRNVLVQATSGIPLLGMSLLYDNLITLEAVDGGEVTIETLE